MEGAREFPVAVTMVELTEATPLYCPTMKLNVCFALKVILTVSAALPVTMGAV
jgi:hypothetical protein